MHPNLDIIIVSIVSICGHIGNKSASEIYEKMRSLPNFGDGQDERLEAYFFEVPKNEEKNELLEEDED